MNLLRFCAGCENTINTIKCGKTVCSTVSDCVCRPFSHFCENRHEAMYKYRRLGYNKGQTLPAQTQKSGKRKLHQWRYKEYDNE